MSAETRPGVRAETSVAHRLPGIHYRTASDRVRQTAGVDARSALFDVYGDHLRVRGGAAPVASLVRLLAPLGITAPAVRTAVSRMVRQAWLTPVRLEAGPGYALTARAERRLAEAAGRIYRSGPAEWDRRWHVVVVDRVGERTARERVRNGMSYLGYAQLRDDVWISPRASVEVDAILEGAGARAQRFLGDHEGLDIALASSAWDLDGLGRAYSRWLKEAHELVGPAAAPTSDEEAFTIRSRLVHEWRKFLFRDPGLPRELLPPSWPGDDAAEFFDAQAARLLIGARMYVDACLRLDDSPGGSSDE
jgi:phenylacetic acid degradation operon negative regulatory protein